MKIEVLYIPGCPNHEPAVERVRSVLIEEGIVAEVVEIVIFDAATAHGLNFLGSPSIRVDGLDIEIRLDTVNTAGLSCRTYVDGAARQGSPPIGLIRRAIGEAKRQRERS